MPLVVKMNGTYDWARQQGIRQCVRSLQASSTPSTASSRRPTSFQFDSFDDELGAMLGEVMGNVDTVILGRVGYQDWAGYWPTAQQDGEFADFINGVPKHVASRTLKQTDLELAELDPDRGRPARFRPQAQDRSRAARSPSWAASMSPASSSLRACSKSSR